MDLVYWKGILESFVKTGGLAIVVAIAGWVFVYKNSRALQKRSETWAIVKNTSDLLKEIESSARKFWLPNDDKFTNTFAYQVEINNFISELERWMVQLEKRIPDKKKLNDDYKTHITQIFRDATYNMETVSNTPEMQRMRITSTVARLTKRIKDRVDTAYEMEFFK